MLDGTCQQCGSAFDTKGNTARKYCSRSCAGLSTRKAIEIPCETCGTPVMRRPCEPKRRYCSHSCQVSARNRTQANPAYHRDITGANNPMFGVKRTGEANPMFGRRKEKAPQWKGGRRTRKDGYVFVIAPEGHPYPCHVKKSGTAWILEHRHVMEQHLGRYLEPGEVVHHVDENPSNNDISNLQLFASQSEHASIGHAQWSDKRRKK